MTPGAIARGVGLAGKTAAQIPSLRGISNVRGLGTTLSTGGARSEEHTSNSSHITISYAVFCLKKKKKNITNTKTKKKKIKQIKKKK